jgi:D-sedoheptulose 7-phosphate isomerase
VISPDDVARRHLLDSAEVQRQLAQSDAVEKIVSAARTLSAVIAAGGKILLCGNGGSAADSQHIAAEFTCRLRASMQRPGIAAIALTTDTSFLTACSNDFGFESVFERLIDALGRQGDALIAISTSGESENVHRAVLRARASGIFTIGLLGSTSGRLGAIVDLPILVPSNSTAHIQESHIAIGHILCELTEEILYGVYRSATP